MVNKNLDKRYWDHFYVYGVLAKANRADDFLSPQLKQGVGDYDIIKLVSIRGASHSLEKKQAFATDLLPRCYRAVGKGSGYSTFIASLPGLNLLNPKDSNVYRNNVLRLASTPSGSHPPVYFGAINM